MEEEFKYNKKKEETNKFKIADPETSFSELKNLADETSGIKQEPNVVQIPKQESVEIKTNNPEVIPSPGVVQAQHEVLEPTPTNKEEVVVPKEPEAPVIIDSSASASAVEEPKIAMSKKDVINYEIERVTTGIKGFDELIGGGFEKGSTVLVVGAVGTGKTMLGLQFLYNGLVEKGEPGMYISFEEDRESLYRHAKQFGWDFEKYEQEGKFRLLEFKPHQMTKIIEEGGGSVRDMLKEIGAKRVVVDSITAYGLLFHDEYTRRDKVLEFLNSLKKWNVTALVVSEEAPGTIENKTGSIGFITDAIISLYYQHDEEKGIRIHSLEVLKMRGSHHTNKLCAMNFEKDGIRVYPDVEVF